MSVYGDGKQIHDWLYVLDHVNALMCVLEDAQAGSVYNIGGGLSWKTLILLRSFMRFLQKLNYKLTNFDSLINYTDDRLGHDFRYAIDNTLISEQLGWSAKYEFLPALDQTIDHYFGNLKIEMTQETK